MGNHLTWAMVIKRGAMSHVIRDLVLPLKTTKSIATQIVDLMRKGFAKADHVGLELVCSHPVTFCAHLQGSFEVKLAPVLIRGLFQAAHETRSDFRYWMDDTGALLLINVDDVEFNLPWQSRNGATTLEIKPALPIITDYLFNKPLNEAVDCWGGYIHKDEPLLCSPGGNGYHISLLTGSGVILFTPNLVALHHWHEGSQDTFSRHVVEADLSSNKLIYWTQRVAKTGVTAPNIVHSLPYSADANAFLPAVIRVNLSDGLISREGLIVENSYKSTNKAGLAPLARYLAHIGTSAGEKGVSAENYECLQRALIELLSLIQNYPIPDVRKTPACKTIYFDVIPKAISSCVQLLFSGSLDVQMIVTSAHELIELIEPVISGTQTQEANQFNHILAANY